MWLVWAVITAFFYGLFDFFVKKTSGKVEDGLAAFIINTISALVLLVYILFAKYKGFKLFATQQGLMFAVIAGIFIGIASMTFIKVFSSGSSLSVGVTIVRVGMIIIGITLGVLVLQEKLDIRQIVGAIMALIGLGLILLK